MVVQVILILTVVDRTMMKRNVFRMSFLNVCDHSLYIYLSVTFQLWVFATGIRYSVRLQEHRLYTTKHKRKVVHTK